MRRKRSHPGVATLGAQYFKIEIERDDFHALRARQLRGQGISRALWECSLSARGSTRVRSLRHTEIPAPQPLRRARQQRRPPRADSRPGPVGIDSESPTIGR
jgi:hypothetical protein